jgi:hypothetical protein
MRIEDFLTREVSKKTINLLHEIEANYVNLAIYLNEQDGIPVNPHRTAALRLLLESKMTMIHAITHP